MCGIYYCSPAWGLVDSLVDQGVSLEISRNGLEWNSERISIKIANTSETKQLVNTTVK